MTLVFALDLAAVFVFALTGALAASRAQLDPIGFIFLAALTAVGGGTVRDLLLDRNPVFWLDQPIFILVAAIAAVIVFFTAHLLESRLKTLTWLDALALGVAVSAGVAVALSLGQDWPVVLIMGVVTGTLGGLMRDVVCNEVPLILAHGELYVSSAFAGAAFAVIAQGLGIGETVAILGCGLVTVALRAGSLAFGWRLPTYKSRPPKR
ncbi:MAG: trimeric intracellular cation channel family protein [Rubricella sp.]